MVNLIKLLALAFIAVFAISVCARVRGDETRFRFITVESTDKAATGLARLTDEQDVAFVVKVDGRVDLVLPASGETYTLYEFSKTKDFQVRSVTGCLEGPIYIMATSWPEPDIGQLTKIESAEGKARTSVATVSPKGLIGGWFVGRKGELVVLSGAKNGTKISCFLSSNVGLSLLWEKELHRMIPPFARRTDLLIADASSTTFVMLIPAPRDRNDGFNDTEIHFSNGNINWIAELDPSYKFTPFFKHEIKAGGQYLANHSCWYDATSDHAYSFNPMLESVLDWYEPGKTATLLAQSNDTKAFFIAVEDIAQEAESAGSANFALAKFVPGTSDISVLQESSMPIPEVGFFGKAYRTNNATYLATMQGIYIVTKGNLLAPISVYMGSAIESVHAIWLEGDL